MIDLRSFDRLILILLLFGHFYVKSIFFFFGILKKEARRMLDNANRAKDTSTKIAYN